MGLVTERRDEMCSPMFRMLRGTASSEQKTSLGRTGEVYEGFTRVGWVRGMTAIGACEAPQGYFRETKTTVVALSMGTAQQRCSYRQAGSRDTNLAEIATGGDWLVDEISQMHSSGRVSALRLACGTAGDGRWAVQKVARLVVHVR